MGLLNLIKKGRHGWDCKDSLETLFHRVTVFFEKKTKAEKRTKRKRKRLKGLLRVPDQNPSAGGGTERKQKKKMSKKDLEGRVYLCSG